MKMMNLKNAVLVTSLVSMAVLGGVAKNQTDKLNESEAKNAELVEKCEYYKNLENRVDSALIAEGKANEALTRAFMRSSFAQSDIIKEQKKSEEIDKAIKKCIERF